MDLQQMRYVVEVATASSFTRAAERCFVTQSALSHQIAALEREIGQRLFVRSSRSVRATEAGEAFIRQAKIALTAADAAREEAAAAEGRVIGTLRLGVIPTVTAVVVPDLIARFRDSHPDTRVELRVGNSAGLSAAVRSGDLDVALLGVRAESKPSGVALRQLARTRLAAAVPPSHPLAEHGAINLSDLEGETFADFPAGTSGRAQSDVAFESAGIRRDVAFEADSSGLILGLVAAGLAVTLLAPGVIASTSVRVTAVALHDGPVRVEYVAWDERAPRAVALAFLNELIDALPADEEAGQEESSRPAHSTT
jgi:DNA-binding transcriptional LysR family regulator